MKTWTLILLLAWPALSGAAVYKWVDELGHVHYGNVPPRLQEEYKEGNDQTVPVYPQTSPRATNKPAPAKPASPQAPASKPAPATQSEPAEAEPAVPKPELSTEERMRQVHERIMHTLQSTPGGRQLLEQGVTEQAATPAQQTPEKTPAGKAETETPAPKTEPPQTESQEKTAPPESTEPATTASSEADEDYAVDIPASEEKMATAAGANNSEAEQAEPGVDPKQRAAQMCGVFTGYVEDYKLRIKNECSGDVCDIYRRQLEKYRKKQQQYCGQLAK